MSDHITDTRFGLVTDENGNERTKLLEVLQDIGKNYPNIHKDTPINKAICIAEAYSVTYGLMRESDPNPLSLVCDSYVEGLDELSGWDLRIDQYSRLNIGDNFKLSVLDFMSLPRRLLSKLIKAAEAIELAEFKQAKQAEEQRERELGAMSNQLSGNFTHTVPKIK